MVYFLLQYIYWDWCAKILIILSSGSVHLIILFPSNRASRWLTILFTVFFFDLFKYSIIQLLFHTLLSCWYIIWVRFYITRKVIDPVNICCYCKHSYVFYLLYDIISRNIKFLLLLWLRMCHLMSRDIVSGSIWDSYTRSALFADYSNILTNPPHLIRSDTFTY